MLTSRNALLIALAATIGLAVLSSTGSAQAPASCDWYAKTAQKQQQENERLKCGLKGPEWSSDLKIHLAWCQGVAPDVWKAMARKRDEQIASCAKK